MKPADIPLREPRLAICRCILETMRLAMPVLAPDKPGDAHLFQLVLAVFVGTAEGKPMSTTKLALYLGIPRETVRRRLKDMIEAGIVEMRRGRACLSESVLTTPQSLKATREIIALFHVAAGKLPKMGDLT
jgi:DNA-binding MarR family transcriptional regulator